MDSIFLDRLTAKIRQNFNKREEPDPEMDMRECVKLHVRQNGELVESVLSLVKRYWERARPNDITGEGKAHEDVLLRLLEQDRMIFERYKMEYLNKFINFDNKSVETEIANHYEVYTTKVRDEIAFLQAVRRREIKEDREKWLYGAIIPVVCVILAAYLTNKAKNTLTEIYAVRRETAELARSSLISSNLIIDGADRFGGMPAHKVAAYKQLQDIENRLKVFFPSIHEDVRISVKTANDEAEKLWKQYQKSPKDQKRDFFQRYMERNGLGNQ